MWLIAGLGNPGLKYAFNWHNCGFMALEVLAQRNAIPITKKKFAGVYGKGKVNGVEAVLLRPETYMNASGLSIRSAMKFYKIEADHLIVMYDDFDLKRGSIRVRDAGGAGTHNGMKSIIEEIGSKNFVRIRIGIGPAPEHYDRADFVLSDIPKEDQETMFTAITQAALAAEERLGEPI